MTRVWGSDTRASHKKGGQMWQCSSSAKIEIRGKGEQEGLVLNGEQPKRHSDVATRAHRGIPLKAHPRVEGI